MDHEKLFTELQQGNEEAFDRIFAAYSDAVYHFLRKNCRTSEDAEDLLQEVFVKFWLHRSRLIPGASPGSYLFAVARNTLLNHVRDQTKKNLLEIFLSDAGVNDAVEEPDDDGLSDMIRQIDLLAQSMPPKRREVYEMRWIKGLSRKEIAETMGISVVTVDIHLRKVLEYLKSVAGKICFLFFF